jgi:(+)-pinoresinol hydroxylase
MKASRAGFARTCAWALAASGILATSAFAEEQSSSWTTFTPRGSDAASPLLKRGEEVYQAKCNLCHGRVAKDVAPGPGAQMSGTQALAAKYGGKKPAVLEDRTDLTADVVKYYVRHGAGIMPFFRKTEVSDAELDAIAAWLARKRARR